MSGISSVGSSMSAASYNPLDKNHDGVVDAQELQEAAQSGLLSASVLGDEDSDDSSDQSPTSAFSGNLASMLLQMQQASASGQAGTDTSSDDSSDQSPMDQLFASLDTNKDGKVSSDEFVAGRPKDMSESDAANLFKSLDTQNSGSLDKDQFAEGLDVLKPTDPSAADVLSQEQPSSDSSSNNADQNALEVFISELQASMNVYQNTYGQYDTDQTDSVAA
ncbi:EF-hand domain-containing protein [Agrobacterium rhizogenes]|nr:EF-hand domain-containing protein [Rhizobium rhizogenes]OCJ31739.1 calcium-binding protein [Agrobacterium sp. B133/95]NTI28163.1 EF-hand domain-containing protein [Rhizobium rhizogenes]NTI47986.1 EF-hand domain-containing protein [Rhizobium rhizogenes]NTI93359.1 EF-hand domain-containing protein [Rhizobium rhizogenes]